MKKIQKSWIVIMLSLITTLFVSTTVFALTGSLDTTFGQDGLVITSFGSFNDQVASIAIQPDGKIVAVGPYSASNGDVNFGLIRYKPNGSIDTSFGTNGKVGTNFSDFDQPASIAIQKDGKILAAGGTVLNLGSDYQFVLARYNTNGSLDTTFNTDGRVFTNLGIDYDSVSALAVQYDGKIIAAGSTNVGVNDDDIAIVRYKPNGDLDTTFDTDGIVTTSIPPYSGFASSVAVEKNGKILVGGVGYHSVFLIRYNPNGSLDTTFNSTGIVTLDFGHQQGSGGQMQIQPDGKILIGGSYSGLHYYYFTIARYNTNGSPDTNFGTNGTVNFIFEKTSSDTGVEGLLLQANKKIVLVGHIRQSESGYDFVLARYNANGTPDTDFGTNGKVITDFGSSFEDDLPRSAILQPDGNIIVAGYTDNDSNFALARYVGDPVLTSTSIAAQDGSILESSETSNSGGTFDTSASTFNIGDDATKKQSVGILSFNTSSLPDTAAITSVFLKVKQQSITGGGNPVVAFQGFMIDIKTGFWGTTANVAAADFQAAATKTYGPFNTSAINNWYSIDLTHSGPFINKLSTNNGLTQIRLRFKLDDNNNGLANYLSLYSGSTAAANRPQLVITYSVP